MFLIGIQSQNHKRKPKRLNNHSARIKGCKMSNFCKDFWLFFKEYWHDFFTCFVPIMLVFFCFGFACVALICEIHKLI